MAGVHCLSLYPRPSTVSVNSDSVSEAFAGLSRIKQHQLVYQLLGDRMRVEIHALSLQTFTPDAWAAAAR